MWRVLLFSIFISSPLFAKTISFACVEDIIQAEGIYLAFAQNQVAKVQETYILISMHIQLILQGPS
jgi:hypothetical protein